MAIVLRGKQKGKIVTIHQFANNWISTDDGKIYSPTSLMYNDKEKEILLNGTNTGMFWNWYQLVECPEGWLIKKINF